MFLPMLLSYSKVLCAFLKQSAVQLLCFVPLTLLKLCTMLFSLFGLILWKHLAHRINFSINAIMLQHDSNPFHLFCYHYFPLILEWFYSIVVAFMPLILLILSLAFLVLQWKPSINELANIHFSKKLQFASGFLTLH